MDDFCFIRDVENYTHPIDNPTELWSRTLSEIEKCDALLIDVSDGPSGGRVVEAGIAYGLGLPIVVIARRDSVVKATFVGICSALNYYSNQSELTDRLRDYTVLPRTNS